MILVLTIMACGPRTEISGNVDGYKLEEIQTAYYGGPFLILATEYFECIDMAWIDRYYDTSGEAPVDVDMTFLQFSFNSSDPATGLYSMSGEAALTGRLFVISDNYLEDYRAHEGQFVIDEIAHEKASGSLELTFSDYGSLSGEWATEYCVNLIE